jgi:hypothetical protein
VRTDLRCGKVLPMLDLARPWTSILLTTRVKWLLWIVVLTQSSRKRNVHRGYISHPTECGVNSLAPRCRHDLQAVISGNNVQKFRCKITTDRQRQGAAAREIPGLVLCAISACGAIHKPCCSLDSCGAARVSLPRISQDRYEGCGQRLRHCAFG